MKEFNFDQSVSEIDDTNLDDDWESVKVGTKSAQGKLIVKHDPGDTDAQGALVVGGEVELNLYPFGKMNGKKYFKIAKALITSVGTGVKRNELIELSIDFKANGGAEIKTVA